MAQSAAASGAILTLTVAGIAVAAVVFLGAVELAQYLGKGVLVERRSCPADRVAAAAEVAVSLQGWAHRVVVVPQAARGAQRLAVQLRRSPAGRQASHI